MLSRLLRTSKTTVATGIGEANKMYYNEKLKCWVVPGEEENKEKEVALAALPPTVTNKETFVRTRLDPSNLTNLYPQPANSIGSLKEALSGTSTPGRPQRHSGHVNMPNTNFASEPQTDRNPLLSQSMELPPANHFNIINPEQCNEQEKTIPDRILELKSKLYSFDDNYSLKSSIKNLHRESDSVELKNKQVDNYVPPNEKNLVHDDATNNDQFGLEPNLTKSFVDSNKFNYTSEPITHEAKSTETQNEDSRQRFDDLEIKVIENQITANNTVQHVSASLAIECKMNSLQSEANVDTLYRSDTISVIETQCNDSANSNSNNLSDVITQNKERTDHVDRPLVQLDQTDTIKVVGCAGQSVPLFETSSDLKETSNSIVTESEPIKIKVTQSSSYNGRINQTDISAGIETNLPKLDSDATEKLISFDANQPTAEKNRIVTTEHENPEQHNGIIDSTQTLEPMQNHKDNSKFTADGSKFTLANKLSRTGKQVNQATRTALQDMYHILNVSGEDLSKLANYVDSKSLLVLDEIRNVLSEFALSYPSVETEPIKVQLYNFKIKKSLSSLDMQKKIKALFDNKIINLIHSSFEKKFLFFASRVEKQKTIIIESKNEITRLQNELNNANKTILALKNQVEQRDVLLDKVKSKLSSIIANQKKK